MRVLVLLLPMLLSGCDSSTEAATALPETPVVTQAPPEHVLAGLAERSDGRRPDMDQLRDTLGAISAKCSNDPREITEAIVDIKAILDRRGITVSTLDLMQRLETNIPDPGDAGACDFSQVAASFRALSAAPPGN